MVSPLTTITSHLLQAALRYIEKRDVKALQAVLQDYPEVVQLREAHGGRGLIHYAAERADLLTVLLDFGADPNMPQGQQIAEELGPVYRPGYTPLYYAARAGQQHAIALLLARCADPNLADFCGGTPLHEARTPQIAESLLKAGADPNAISSLRYFDEENLGWYFAGSPLHSAGDPALIRTLVSHGAQVDIAADHITMRTPLHYAAAVGNADAVNTLLELGANPNAVCEVAGYNYEARMTPLHYAARNGHRTAVRILLKAGAIVDLQGGQTARDLALEAGHDEVASILAAAAPFTPAMGYAPDYGLRLLRDGVSPTVDVFFYDFHLFNLDVIEAGHYSTTVWKSYEGETHAVTLDFNQEQLEQILAQAEPQLAARLRAELSHDRASPRSIDLIGSLAFRVRARLGSPQTVAKEQFVPLIAEEIL